MKKIISISVFLFSLVSVVVAQSGQKMTIMITHEVKDYTTWKKAFDEDEAIRKQVGVTIKELYVAIDKPTLVTIIAEANSPEFLSNPHLKEAMDKAGVISKPEIKLLYKAN